MPEDDRDGRCGAPTRSGRPCRSRPPAGQGRCRRHHQAGPTSPSGLSPRALRLWAEILDEWELDPDALLLLELACRATTRMERAEELLDEAGGLMSTGSMGQAVAHPLLGVIDRERRAVLAALKQLDLAPPDDDPDEQRDDHGRFTAPPTSTAGAQVVPIRRRNA
jgi:hypothetical protein